MAVTSKLIGTLIKKRKRNNTLECIDNELVKVLLNEMRKKYITPGLGEEISIEWYTQATTTTKHENWVIFYAHPYFQGRKWSTALGRWMTAIRAFLSTQGCIRAWPGPDWQTFIFFLIASDNVYLLHLSNATGGESL
jgi:hypothetical protein